MSQVKVAINSKNNLVFTPKTTPSSNGKTYGFYILESEHESMENGFYRKQRRTATLTLDVTTNPNWKAGHVLNGRIVVKESHTPFYDGQPCKINPTTKAEVLVNGKRVYRQSQYTEIAAEQDALIVSSVVVSTPAVQLNVTGM